MVPPGSVPEFRAVYAADDAAIAARWLAEPPLDPSAEARIDQRATTLIAAIREASGGLGGIEDFLHAYSLSTREGLALMGLAEALLRVPDAATADRLIEDKLEGGDWAQADRPGGLFVTASAFSLDLGARMLDSADGTGVFAGLTRRLGAPAVRLAARQAMRLLGSHFVLGQSIGEALKRAGGDPRYRYSFDMLGEGARTATDAARYFDSYATAIEVIGASATGGALPDRPGLSVKLSALHPRYEAVSRKRVLRELTPRLLDLARAAKRHDLNLTIDAEEADRLELSLDVIGAVLADRSLAGWEGFGLAVQAYQKRAEAVIGWCDDIAKALNRRLMVRLVKGAYWDTEIKRAQERGLADYPVFTRKPMTDLSFMACTAALLSSRPRLYPQIATHNALTVASTIAMAGGVTGFEFQRLHGMGDALYDALLEAEPQAACRVYAPVGSHRELLAYLVRRLLENGANASFVAMAADPAVPVGTLLRRPRDDIPVAGVARSRTIPRPADLYGARKNSRGVEFGDRAALDGLRREIAAAPAALAAPPKSDPDAAMAAAHMAFAAWEATPLAERATVLERAADLLEAERGDFLALLVEEGGKTLDDALAEVREAIDYARYYAAEARRTLAPQALPSPTGESNELRHRGRGVFVCISPWNFPLAIFFGQVAAALVAGNTVCAKPAEQTPRVAALVVDLLHRAGVPRAALQLVVGEGKAGAALVADPRCAGVAFTGSTAVAHAINRALAIKDGAIVPLIAETGGINAMIVDATALPEQVTDDVVASAFRSAGQRCSALRLLCLQEDVADRMIAMIAGAAAELTLGDPADPATHVGPVIDDEAKARLDGWIAANANEGRVLFRWDLHRPVPAGRFVSPAMIRLDRASDLTEEVFGPVLHVVRWKADGLDSLLDAIMANGTGLTLGVQSRIEGVAARIFARMRHGNVYVNRSMIGAVVSTQPFGGTSLSGTGPKAGGPSYIRRFATEQTVTVNTAAAGGDAALMGGPTAT